MAFDKERYEESSESFERQKVFIEERLWLKELKSWERSLPDLYNKVDAFGRTFWGGDVKIQHKCFNGHTKYGKPKNIILPIMRNKEKNHGIMQSNKFEQFNRDYVIFSCESDYLTCEIQYELYIFDFEVLYMMFSIFYEHFKRGIKDYYDEKDKEQKIYCVVFDFQNFLKLYYQTVMLRTNFIDFINFLIDNTEDVSVKAMKEILYSDSVESKDKKSLKGFWEQFKEARPEGSIDVKDPLEFLKQIEGKA